jgi:hypothetical protein
VGRDEVEEAGEAGVEVVAAQPVEAAGALVVLADQAGLAQHLEVAARVRPEPRRERDAVTDTVTRRLIEPGRDLQA